jgi:hypothetical protein
MLLAAAYVVLELSAFQLGACIAITFASIALAFLLGLDEGQVRGRRQGRVLEREALEHDREQLRQGCWPAVGRGHGR